MTPPRSVGSARLGVQRGKHVAPWRSLEASVDENREREDVGETEVLLEAGEAVHAALRPSPSTTRAATLCRLDDNLLRYRHRLFCYECSRTTRPLCKPRPVSRG